MAIRRSFRLRLAFWVIRPSLAFVRSQASAAPFAQHLYRELLESALSYGSW